MSRTEQPELIDWHEEKENNRFIGLYAAPLLSTLFLGGLWGFNACYPRNFQRMQDYYTCSPRYICKPVPYWPGQ